MSVVAVLLHQAYYLIYGPKKNLISPDKNRLFEYVFNSLQLATL